ncbi:MULTISPECIES: S24 family peptidase [Pseudomonas]|jgi:phage repressor protein C with HTH and peptisase S24 domain|uniref:S24 family peptidase n=1 Tax=Pseudomonas TaxID=286 RepID=UPI000D95D4EC|nr:MULTISPECIES: S24 family peptidase [Pseudomonas]PYB87154.1 Cro/Cl family transcriptional regulator [Pseudomonas fulva]PYC10955.1 Cro/Cl family transcriptional regulator [Pseudomonas fulva]
MEFKDRVVRRMRELDISSTDLSKLSGVSKATVSFWINGTNGAKGKNLLALAKALKCSPQWLSDGTGSPGDVAAHSEAPASSTAELVAQMLASRAGKNLSEKAREVMLAAAAEADNPTPTQEYLPSAYSNLRPKQDEILIPQYDVRAAMGHGQVPADYNEAVRNLVVREDTLREKGVTYTSPTALAMITGWGQSMEGTINDKDLVIVDRGVNEFVGEGIYVITWHQELYIKRMMRLDEDHFRLISDNPHYENQTARIDDVTIHAKVLLIWNAKKA